MTFSDIEKKHPTALEVIMYSAFFAALMYVGIVYSASIAALAMAIPPRTWLIAISAFQFISGIAANFWPAILTNPLGVPQHITLNDRNTNEHDLSLKKAYLNALDNLGLRKFLRKNAKDEERLPDLFHVESGVEVIGRNLSDAVIRVSDTLLDRIGMPKSDSKDHKRDAEYRLEAFMALTASELHNRRGFFKTVTSAIAQMSAAFSEQRGFNLNMLGYSVARLWTSALFLVGMRENHRSNFNFVVEAYANKYKNDKPERERRLAALFQAIQIMRVPDDFSTQDKMFSDLSFAGIKADLGGNPKELKAMDDTFVDSEEPSEGSWLHDAEAWINKQFMKYYDAVKPTFSKGALLKEVAQAAADSGIRIKATV